MTPRGGRSSRACGDNTPQGKLARGCGWLIAMVFGFFVLIGVVDVIAHGVCRYIGTDCRAWECGWFRICKVVPA